MTRAAPQTGRRHCDELELPADLNDIRHGPPVNPDQTANVILQPLFLLLRVFDNTKPREASGRLRDPGLNPAPSARPEFSAALTLGRHA
jgi:hypothetical protein